MPPWIRGSVLPNDDDGEIVGEVASCEVARVFRDRGRERARRLRRERRRRLDRFLRERVAGAEGEDAKRGNDLGRQGNGDDGPRPALLEKRNEGRQELLASIAPGAEHEGTPVAEEPLHV